MVGKKDKKQVEVVGDMKRGKETNVDVKKATKTTSAKQKETGAMSEKGVEKKQEASVAKAKKNDTTNKTAKSIVKDKKNVSNVEATKKKDSKSVVAQPKSVSEEATTKAKIKTDKNKKEPVEVKESNNDDYSINSKQLDLSNEKDNFNPSLSSKMYREVIVPKLQQELNIKNVMAVPRLVKICVNQGVGSISGDKKQFEIMRNDLSNICGQKAINCKSKKAISNFKLKEGANIACMVTLRNKKMYEFLDRLINIVLPRIRDFRGLRVDSFDNYGVYNIGLKEQIIFPEVNIDKNMKIIGMNISIITTSRNKDWNLALLKAFGFPFKKK